MKPGGPATYFVVLVTFFAAIPGGRAQEWISLDPLEWKVTSKLDASREKSGEVTSNDMETETAVRLRQSGYTLDPAIGVFSVEVSPTFAQGRFRTSAEGLDDDRDILFLDFNASASAFPGTTVPVSADVAASRSTGSIGTSLGSRSDFTNESRYVGVNWKTPYFPTTLSYDERIIDQEFRSGLSSAVVRRDDTLRTVKVKGRSKKMDLEVSHGWFTDAVATTDRDYTEDRAGVSHFFRWGKGSTLNSRVDFFDRRGFLGSDGLSITEDARLQHTKNLSTNYNYRFFTFQTETETTSHTGVFGVTHQLYQNLTTNFRAEARAESFDAGTEDEYEGRLDFNYRKGIFWGGQVSAGIGGGYGILDRESSGALLSVRDEAHVVPATRIVLLVQRFIDTATIVATDITGAIVLTEGVDYTIAPTANNLTEFRVLATSPVINIGDTVLVSYSYESLPSVTFSQIPYRVEAGLDFGWVRLFHRTFGEDQSLISGEDEDALNPTRDSTTGIEFKWSPGGGEVSVGAEKRFFRSGDLEIDTIAYTQSLFYPVFAEARLALSGSESFIESEGTDTDLYTADLTLNWRPMPRLSINPKAGLWIREEDRVGGERAEERFTRAGLDVEWSFLKVDVSLRYTHEQRRGTITPRDEDRLILTIVRRSK